MKTYKHEVESLLKLSYSKNGTVRAEAIRQLCPCRLKTNIPQVWERIIELAEDESHLVRFSVLHMLCDGSPNTLKERIVSVLQKMHNDSNSKLRRKVRRVLAHHKRTGKINIL